MENEMNTQQMESEKSLAQMLAEAEERGYRRGVEQRLAEPGVWEQPGIEKPAEAPDSFRILEGARRSIWD